MITLSWVATETARQMVGGDRVSSEYEELVIDGTASEGYQLSSTATEHAVETGASTTDHVRRELRKLTLEIAVSAHAVIDQISNIDSPATRPATVRSTIQRLVDEAIIVEVTTNVASWKSMLVLDFSENRTGDAGDGLVATLTLREFREVSTEEIDAPSPRVERGRRRASTGRQPATDAAATAPVPTVAKLRSVALSLLGR